LTGRFRYKPSVAEPSPADPDPLIWRPVMPIKIWGLGKRRTVEALVDTGAIETLLPMKIWKLVDPITRPDEEEDFELEAANGSKISVRYATVDLGFWIGRHRLRWGAKVAFTPDRDEAVLGDAGFFRYFSVTFNRPERFLDLQNVVPLPPSIAPFDR
jgi:hypothetical protein